MFTVVRSLGGHDQGIRGSSAKFWTRRTFIFKVCQRGAGRRELKIMRGKDVLEIKERSCFKKGSYVVSKSICSQARLGLKNFN